ncbi:OmpA family protein [Alcaligenaceae bacterium]|nr:OmpA family protein [Alcaligenaceae bacterium]
MFKSLKTFTRRTSGVLLVLTLAACGSLSKVSEHGTTDNPVWPDAGKATFDVGAYPTLHNLRLVAPGMTKDQLYNLLGRPHFAEGLVGVREWDYLFHFRTPQGDVTCQYKILFDNDKRAQSFFWQPESCASMLGGAQPEPQTFSLNGDVLFAFGSATLTTAGQSEVARVASALGNTGNSSVDVVGHTDYIGSDTSNMTLSQRRAQSVRDALIGNGVPANVITARGAGETQPVVHCNEGPRAELIACLQPNRRVDITATARR